MDFFNSLAHNEQAVGYLAVAGAVLFFGSFAVPLKTRRVQEANVDPVVFQLYYSLSIFCSSFLVLAYNPWVFTPFGIAGAAFWVPASILSIFAINYLGMSVAVGTWAGVTIVVSFLWGSIVFRDPVHSILLSVVALSLLIGGILGLSLSNSEFVKNLGNKRTSQRNINVAEDEAPLLNDDTQQAAENKAPNATGKLIGLMCALVLGVLNGSMMVPLRYTPPEASGIKYIVSFGIGVMIVTPVCALFYFAIIKRQIPQLHLRVALIPGLITGLLWNVGNFCSIYATLNLGLTIGFPLTQLALVVSGLWGLLVFKELRGAMVISFWIVSVLILLGGAALLSLYG